MAVHVIISMAVHVIISMAVHVIISFSALILAPSPSLSIYYHSEGRMICNEIDKERKEDKMR